MGLYGSFEFTLKCRWNYFVLYLMKAFILFEINKTHESYKNAYALLQVHILYWALV